MYRKKEKSISKKKKEKREMRTVCNVKVSRVCHCLHRTLDKDIRINIGSDEWRIRKYERRINCKAGMLKASYCRN